MQIVRFKDDRLGIRNVRRSFFGERFVYWNFDFLRWVDDPLLASRFRDEFSVNNELKWLELSDGDYGEPV